MTACPKPEPKGRKPRRPMNKIGPVGRRRLAANARRKAENPPWMNVCEVAPVLRNWGITFVRCLGELTWAHARKKRSKDAAVGSAEHEDTVCRACTLHHYKYLDELMKADDACAVVMEAIKRRRP